MTPDGRSESHAEERDVHSRPMLNSVSDKSNGVYLFDIILNVAPTQ